MKKIICATFILFFLVQSSFAVRVKDIYKAEVPVVSQSSADKDQALKNALAQVLIKVSGNNNVLNNANIKSRLNSAPQLLQAFGYLKSNNANYPYLLQAQFYPEGVNKILRDTGTPIWGVNRPLVLIWATFEEAEKSPELIDNSSQNEIAVSIKQHASMRGLPVIFPMMDVRDLSIVTVNDLLNMDLQPLQVAASRYNSAAILLVRFAKLPANFAAVAKFVINNEIVEWNITANSIAEITQTLTDNVADKLGSKLSIVVTNAVQEKMTITVRGIARHQDYNHLMNYLQNLPQVGEIQIAEITGDAITLNINIRGTQESLIKGFAVGNRLRSLETANNNQTDYQWNK